jgi:hypothetical protein
MKSLENYNQEPTFSESLIAAFWVVWGIVKEVFHAPPVAPPESTPVITRNGKTGVLPFTSAKRGEKTATRVNVGGQFYDATLETDEAGKITVASMTPAKIRARAKPNGVSDSSGSLASGIENVASRVSMDTDQFGTGLESFVVFSRDSYWSQFLLSDNLSLAELRTVPIDKVAELLATVSPEVSQGLWIRTIFSNSGYETRALKIGGDGAVDTRAQKELDLMREKVGRQNGTEDVFYNRMFNTFFIRGSILAELVLDNREFAGIVTPDPKTLKFQRKSDPVLGRKWTFGQLQNGKFVDLDIETIRYVPLNPFPNSIEGNPLISSSFFIAVFLMAVLRDFKRVIQQQGYPRYDIEIELEKLRNIMPEAAENDEREFQIWANGVKDSIKHFIADLEPDETFIHFSGVKVNQPVGAMGTNSLTSIDGLFKGLERMAARALKVPPLFMGITDAVSEANANRQFEAFLLDIANGQHAVENVVSDLYELALQAKGIVCKVEHRFAPMRSSERLRDAQAAMSEAEYAEFCFRQGWISQDEAAKRGAKVDKAFQAEPRQSSNTGATGGSLPPQLDNGVNRTLRTPTLADLQRAKTIFQEFAPDGAESLIVADTSDGNVN